MFICLFNTCSFAVCAVFFYVSCWVCFYAMRQLLSTIGRSHFSLTQFIRLRALIILLLWLVFFVLSSCVNTLDEKATQKKQSTYLLVYWCFVSVCGGIFQSTFMCADEAIANNESVYSQNNNIYSFQSAFYFFILSFPIKIVLVLHSI